MKADMVKWKERGDRFLNSWQFIALCAAMVAVSWIFNLVFVLIPIFILGIGALFAFRKDGRAAISIICVFCLAFNPQVIASKLLIPFAVGFGSVAAIALIYRVVRIFLYDDFTLGHLFWGMVAAAVACAFGGLGYNNSFVNWLVTIAWCVMGFVIYLIFVNSLPKGGVQFAANLVIFLALIAVVETVAYYVMVYLRNNSLQDVLTSFHTKDLDLGWGKTNNVAGFMTMGIPFALYKGLKSKYNFLYILLAVLFFAGILFNFSRGNLLFMSILLIPIGIYVLYKSTYKGRFLLTMGILIAVLLVCFIAFYKQFENIFTFFREAGFNDRGRKELYELAVNDFLKAPIFGMGLYNDPIDRWTKYHQTLLQIMVNFGVVGLLGFSVFIWKKYSIFFFCRSEFKVMAFFAILVNDLYGMMDLFFYNPYFLFPIFVIIVAAEKETLAMKRQAEELKAIQPSEAVA